MFFGGEVSKATLPTNVFLSTQDVSAIILRSALPSVPRGVEALFDAKRCSEIWLNSVIRATWQNPHALCTHILVRDLDNCPSSTYASGFFMAVVVTPPMSSPLRLLIYGDTGDHHSASDLMRC